MQLDSSPDMLRAHTWTLADEIGERNVFRPDALHWAERYITQTWHEQGYEVVPQEYTLRAARSANLEITRYGKSRPNEILLLGAHYDSVVGSPGANDNASGVAALLELSRLFASTEPARTVRFVAFVNEEPPFFMSRDQGSRHYARAARRRDDDIRLMLSLETLGYYCNDPGSQRYPPLFRLFYPDRADFVAFVSNFRSRRAMLELARAFRASTDFPLQHAATFSFVPGVAWSDHLSFWLRRYKALMVTDTAFYRYPYYHTPLDTPEKLDYESLARVTTGLHKAVGRLAQAPL
ncbi:MAG: M28 family peptidase [Gammaproteobacteria bacterium]|nr:M28 family peptidase [Gammaproteobacteria bacterium]NIR82409.1 M28 family peptidase [Gammaproteobacteria bacterium]NIR91990.1 M28 family peptidase [Gammaproteobacteria bacterium]NIU03546.1 M28 family peptidase [Gammaproteobacteria bacterium]NIX84820.1 M28 family peptidase [Gammaproteobacteria bacterium]